MKRSVAYRVGLRWPCANLLRWVVPLLGFTAFLFLSPAARADLIYQSAASLLTGTWSNAGGVETDSNFNSGVNFYLSTPATVQDIGGKFSPLSVTGNNEIFGAIVPVNGQFDKPDLANALGTTLLTLPGRNDAENISGPLSLSLTPGWYALLFGTNQFGATGQAFAVETINNQLANTTTGDITYAIRISDGTLIEQAAGARYFVEGSLQPAVAAPEPASFTLLGLGLTGLAGYGWRRRRG